MLRGKIAFIIIGAVLIVGALAATFVISKTVGDKGISVSDDELLSIVTELYEKNEQFDIEAEEILVSLAGLPSLKNQDRDACEEDLLEALRSNPRYANLGLIDLGGRVVCSALLVGEDVNLTDRLYFQQALELNDFAIGEYQIGRITGAISINFGYPVIDDGGEVKGVVFAALPLLWLKTHILAQDLEENWIFMVIDQTMTVVARFPDNGFVGSSVFGTLLGEALSEHESGVIKSVGVDGIERRYAFRMLRDTDGASGNVFMVLGLSIK